MLSDAVLGLRDVAQLARQRRDGLRLAYREFLRIVDDATHLGSFAADGGRLAAHGAYEAIGFAVAALLLRVPLDANSGRLAKKVIRRVKRDG